MTPQERIVVRTVGNKVRMIREHLEAMQRDAHGLEYGPWKVEVDELWKEVFTSINSLDSDAQPAALESIKDLWMTYITHYNVGLN